MGIELLPEFVRSHYEAYEWKHACAILKNDFQVEWKNLTDLITRILFMIEI